MILQIPVNSSTKTENIPFTLSLDDVQFLINAADCFMAVLAQQSDVADMTVLFDMQYKNIKKALTDAQNYCLGFSCEVQNE